MPLQTDFRESFKKASVPAKRIMGTIKSGERIYDEEFTFQGGLKFALKKNFDLDNFSNDTDIHVKKDGTVIVEEWTPVPKENVGKWKPLPNPKYCGIGTLEGETMFKCKRTMPKKANTLSDVKKLISQARSSFDLNQFRDFSIK